MARTSKWQIADELYASGQTLFQQGKYEEALEKLRRAEDFFRRVDARGHPFLRPLQNGISGLANTLFLEGRCYEYLQEFDRAVTCFETCFIHEKFEKRRPFKAFKLSIQQHLSSCYDKLVQRTPPEALEKVVTNTPSINISYQFPFSLSPDGILVARLYELSPDRHERFKAFYMNARTRDAELRKQDMRSDEGSLKTLSAVIWGVIGALWLFYGVMVARMLFLKQ